MATTIGRVDFIVGLDGTTLPSQARAFGERLGRILGQVASARMSRELGDGLRSNSGALDRVGQQVGERFGRRFGMGFQNQLGPALQKAISGSGALEDIGELIVVTERAGDAARGTGNDFTWMRRELEGSSEAANRNTSTFGRLRNTLGGLADRLRDVGDRMNYNVRTSGLFSRAAGRAFRAAGAGGRGLGSVIDELNEKWRGMTHGVRQATFYVALFANLATQIAVLGSAAGSGLTIVAAAAFQGAIGLGVFITAFSVLMGDIEEVPAALRPAAEAFKAIGDSFAILREQIAERAFANIVPVFQALNGLIATLTPSILLVADAVGRVVANLVGMLTSTNGISVLNTLIANSAAVFELLMDAVFELGGALGNIFVAAQPYVMIFSQWLSDLFGRFNEWTQSLEGQNALAAWFENGLQVFQGLGDLLGQAGDMLNALVTPATVASLLEFMNIIGELLAPLGEFLLMLGEFEIFNLIADVLLTVFAAIQPLMPLLSELGSLFSTVLQAALRIITPLLALVAELFVALVEPIVSALMPSILQLIPIFSALVTAVMPIIEALVLIGTTIAEAVAPFLQSLAMLVVNLVQAFMPLIESIVPPLVQILTSLAEVLGPILSAVLDPLIVLVEALFTALEPIFPVVTELVSAFLELLAPLLELIGPILAPLTALLKGLVEGGVAILMSALDLLMPVIMGVVNAVRGLLMPVFKMFQEMLGGLIDFLVGVFTGNWEKAWNGIVRFFKGAFDGLLGFLKGVVNGLIDIVNGITSGINNISSKVGIPAIPKIPKLARGGIAWQSMLANIGEAGPEMVVPLRRPLGMVDPAVRDVAAYAQGKTTGRGGGDVIFEDGAIRVTEVNDGAYTANEVVQRVAKRVGG